MILKSIIDSLKPEDRARLFHAFDHYFSQFVILPNNKFIGVNMICKSNFIVEEQVGAWSFGSTITNDN